MKSNMISKSITTDHEYNLLEIVELDKKNLPIRIYPQIQIDSREIDPKIDPKLMVHCSSRVGLWYPMEKSAQ